MATSIRTLLQKGNIDQVLKRLDITDVTPGLVRSISSWCTHSLHLFQIVEHITPRLMEVFARGDRQWDAWQEEDVLMELLSNTARVDFADALMRGANISPKTAEIVLSKMMITEYEGTHAVLAHMLQFHTFGKAAEHADVQMGIGAHTYNVSYLKTLHEAGVTIPWAILLHRTFCLKHKDFLSYAAQHAPVEKKIFTNMMRQLTVLSSQGIAHGAKDNWLFHHLDFNEVMAALMEGVRRENAGMLAWNGRERVAAATMLVQYERCCKGFDAPASRQGFIALLSLPMVERGALLDDVLQYSSSDKFQDDVAQAAWNVGDCIVEAMSEQEMGRMSQSSMAHWAQQPKLSHYMLTRAVGAAGHKATAKKM